MHDTVHPSRPFVVLRSKNPDPHPLQGAIAALGNFDGVHRGHRAVIAAAQRQARAMGTKAVALTFEPHPRSFFRPQDVVFRLTDERGKLRLLAGCGLDGAIVLPFQADLAQLTAEDFITTVLLQGLRLRGVAVGFDFHFGKGRGGSPELLSAYGGQRGLAVEVVPKFEDEGRPISSGVIRAALAEGKVIEAAELLGYPWFVSGTVIHGEKRGRVLGFPTANLRLDPACGLKHGIYAVRVDKGGRRYGGVASFGRRPTFDNGAPLLEIFLFDFDGSLYDAELDVCFIAWIRPEQRFETVEQLVQQMHDDAARARAALERAGDIFPPLGRL